MNATIGNQIDLPRCPIGTVSKRQETKKPNENKWKSSEKVTAKE